MNLRKYGILFILSIQIIQFNAQTPVDQVTNFSIIDTFAWKINISFKVPTTCDSAIMIISKSPLTSLTLSNKYYGVGYTISSGIKVLKKFYKGTNLIYHTISGLEANTTYYLAFYTFNNNVQGIFYNQTNPPRYSFKTKGKNIGKYYYNVDTNKAVFLSSIASLLRNHDNITANYSDFRNVVSEVYERDTFINDTPKKYVVCAYSGQVATYTGSFSFSTTNFNREHTLPKNWMNFRGVANPDLVNYPEGADWHNLTLASAVANSQRSDYVYKIPKIPSSIGNARYYENKSNYSDTNNCFEPQNSYKGDAARCVLYMQLCYHRQIDSNWGFKNGLHSFAKYQNQELLKQWARNDTPDNQEIARHEYIASIQGNRNPFIDFPDWVDCIDFNDIHQLKTCQGLSTKPITGSVSPDLSDQWDVWYYPYTSRQYILKYYMNKISYVDLKILDINGKTIQTESQKANEGENSFWLHLDNIQSGIYYLYLHNVEHHKMLKLLVE